MKKLLIFGLLAVGFFACKKEDPQPGSNDVVEDIPMKRLTSFPWLVYKATLNGNNIWNLGLIDACQKDDTYKFNRDSSLINFENTNVCSGNPDSTMTDWRFYQGRDKLIATMLGITDTALILALDTADMQLQVNYQGSPVILFFKKN